MSGDDRVALVTSRLRDVRDFPKPGIVFKDITPLLADPMAFSASIDWLAEVARPLGVDAVVAIESRGFLFGVPLAMRLGVGFVPVRKPGKLPAATTRVEYALEYGTDVIEMHTDALRPGARALVVDDVLATGGTAAAAAELVRRVGAEPVAAAFFLEIEALGGASRLAPIPTRSMVRV